MMAQKAAEAKKQTKARAKRAALKKAVPRPTEPSQLSGEALDETVIVDPIEEPGPGVVAITEAKDPPRSKKNSRLKVSRKLYKSLKKEAQRNDLSVSELALEITERGIRKRKKSKT
jgi:hypothetical protein